MKVAEYIKELEEVSKKFSTDAKGSTLAESFMETASIWNNDACKGYAVMAMKKADLTEDEIIRVLAQLNYCFDFYTLEEAEEVYNSL